MAEKRRVCGKCKGNKSVKGAVEMRPDGQRSVYACSNGHEEEMTAGEQMNSLGYKPMI